jgi:hypothetical protein
VPTGSYSVSELEVIIIICIQVVLYFVEPDGALPTDYYGVELELQEPV